MEVPGSRSQFTSSARKAKKLEPPFKEALIKIDKDWDDPHLWNVMKRASNPLGGSFYLAAVDMRYDERGEIVRVEPKKRIYVQLFLRTLWLSALISCLCLVLAFPVAHLLATLPLRYSNLLMIFVLLPFWTSLGRHHHCDDAHTVAIHDSATVLSNEINPAYLRSGRAIFGCQLLDRVLESVLPANGSRYWRRCAVGLYTLNWVLYNPGFGGWLDGSIDFK